MELTTRLATQNDCYQRNLRELSLPASARDAAYAQYYTGPRGVMLHSTGANNPNLTRYTGPNPYDNDWNRPGLAVCVHAFVGKNEAGEVASCQILPWAYRAWHCGGLANNTHLSIELCEDGLTDARYFAAVYEEAASLTAWLCKEYSLDPGTPGVVIDHAEGHALGVASNHGDVAHWFSRHGKTMADFRKEVAKKMAETAAPSRYQTVEQLPDWAKESIRRLVEKEALKGTGTGLDLTADMLRLLVVMDRLTR